MFKFIKNLFNKKKESEVATMDVDNIDIPDVSGREELERIAREREEKSIVLAKRAVEIQTEIDRTCHRLGIVHKFRDTNTGEIHIVQPGDHEAFNKMMFNKDMQMVFD